MITNSTSLVGILICAMIAITIIIALSILITLVAAAYTYYQYKKVINIMLNRNEHQEVVKNVKFKIVSNAI